jgi:predicted nuclease of restriction endonuclease-like (RecB) superfamily
MSEILKNEIRILDDRYTGFLSEIKEQIANAKLRVVKTTTREQIKLYFWLGKHIVETQLKYGWGKFIVENLSKDLRKAFDSKFGFSAQNLWYMRQFYLEYKDTSKLQQLVGEIPWGQNLLILSKVKDFKAREYYLEAVKEPNENPSIGIILCSEKDRFEVEYSLKGIDKPVGVSEYKLTRNLPNELINKLPNPELLEKELLREMNIILEQEEMQSQQIKECNSKQGIHL